MRWLVSSCLASVPQVRSICLLCCKASPSFVLLAALLCVAGCFAVSLRKLFRRPVKFHIHTHYASGCELRQGFASPPSSPTPTHPQPSPTRTLLLLILLVFLSAGFFGLAFAGIHESVPHEFCGAHEFMGFSDSWSA